MNQIMVVFWSQTGNTEAMANAVAEGIREAGKDALVTEVSHISARERDGAVCDRGGGICFR